MNKVFNIKYINNTDKELSKIELEAIHKGNHKLASEVNTEIGLRRKYNGY